MRQVLLLLTLHFILYIFLLLSLLLPIVIMVTLCCYTLRECERSQSFFLFIICRFVLLFWPGVWWPIFVCPSFFLFHSIYGQWLFHQHKTNGNTIISNAAIWKNQQMEIHLTKKGKNEKGEKKPNEMTALCRRSTRSLHRRRRTFSAEKTIARSRSVNGFYTQIWR